MNFLLGLLLILHNFPSSDILKYEYHIQNDEVNDQKSETDQPNTKTEKSVRESVVRPYMQDPMK